MLSPADLFESQYTPTSNNLTSVLVQLREVHPLEVNNLTDAETSSLCRANINVAIIM